MLVNFLYWPLNLVRFFRFVNQDALALMMAVVLTAMVAMVEARSERFQNKLVSGWRTTQVDLARAKLRAQERSLLSSRGRPTFQRDRLRRMQATQKDFFDEMKRSDASRTPVQQEIVDQAMRAFSRYYELLQKEQRVAGLLESTNRHEIERDITRLEKQADASSSEARSQYLRAAEFRKQELRSLERAEQLSALLNAHMDALESALASMRTRIINSEVWDVRGGNAYTDLTQELLALEKAFAEVAELEKDSVFIYEKV
ncbi:MAG: FUSC family protein [Symbiobacteriaceae bacterium]|nr:FUSC family protein [Symbiobacteriaceae bacterium]